MMIKLFFSSVIIFVSLGTVAIANVWSDEISFKAVTWKTTGTINLSSLRPKESIFKVKSGLPLHHTAVSLSRNTEIRTPETEVTPVWLQNIKIYFIITILAGFTTVLLLLVVAFLFYFESRIRRYRSKRKHQLISLSLRQPSVRAKTYNNNWS